MPKTLKVQPAAGNRDLPDAVKHFDQLPDSARINSRCFKTLLNCGDTTFWRRRRAGVIPPPDDFGTWGVATVRKILSGNQGAA